MALGFAFRGIGRREKGGQHGPGHRAVGCRADDNLEGVALFQAGFHSAPEAGVAQSQDQADTRSAVTITGFDRVGPVTATPGCAPKDAPSSPIRLVSSFRCARVEKRRSSVSNSHGTGLEVPSRVLHNLGHLKGETARSAELTGGCHLDDRSPHQGSGVDRADHLGEEAVARLDRLAAVEQALARAQPVAGEHLADSHLDRRAGPQASPAAAEPLGTDEAAIGGWA